MRIRAQYNKKMMIIFLYRQALPTCWKDIKEISHFNSTPMVKTLRLVMELSINSNFMNLDTKVSNCLLSIMDTQIIKFHFRTKECHSRNIGKTSKCPKPKDIIQMKDISQDSKIFLQGNLLTDSCHNSKQLISLSLLEWFQQQDFRIISPLMSFSPNN